MTTTHTETTPDRLDVLDATAPAANRPDLFRLFVLGALSHLVDDETWEKAMSTARKCDADYSTPPPAPAYTPPF